MPCGGFRSFSPQLQIVVSRPLQSARTSSPKSNLLWRHFADMALSHSASIEGREERAQLSQSPRSEVHPACGFAVDTPDGNIRSCGFATVLWRRVSAAAQEAIGQTLGAAMIDIGLPSPQVSCVRRSSLESPEGGFDGFR
jgi:hypothetical protein